MREAADAPAHCLNCETELLGRFCHRCGQLRDARIRPLRALLSDVASESLSLDTRLFRTLRALLTRPGRLTDEYIAGHRAPYVTPFRLYLAISVIYFLVIALAGSGSFFFFVPSEGDGSPGAFSRCCPD